MKILTPPPELMSQARTRIAVLCSFTLLLTTGAACTSEPVLIADASPRAAAADASPRAGATAEDATRSTSTPSLDSRARNSQGHPHTRPRQDSATRGSQGHPTRRPSHHSRPSGGLEGQPVRRFWVADKNFYFSRWYAGKHRKMINFGCTRAPYYAPSPLCTNERGFHHGLDVAMPCGTRLFAGFAGKVVRPRSPGALGSAYGDFAFRLRNHRIDRDVVFGHVRRVYVRPGDRVPRGALVARASDEGAPDGCHLHFEVRPKAGSYDQAVNPHSLIDLRRRRSPTGA